MRARIRNAEPLEPFGSVHALVVNKTDALTETKLCEIAANLNAGSEEAEILSLVPAAGVPACTCVPPRWSVQSTNAIDELRID